MSFPHTAAPPFAAIADGLAASTVPVTHADDPTRVARHELLSTPVYDAYLMAWPPGLGVDEHAHETIVAISVVAGELEETLAHADGSVVVRPLTAGTTVQLAAGRQHRIVNVGGTTATTVHVHERIPA